MSDNEIKIVEPKESKRAKYGPILFWGTIVGMPVMNMTAAIFNYKSLKLQLEIERLKKVTNHIQ